MKEQRGSILIITLVTLLFMIAFLISTFTIIANRRQVQAEIRTEVKELYEEDLENIDDIYAQYFAEPGTAIPIYTVEQLLSVGTNKYILSGEKIYYYSPEADYILKNEIEFKVADYIDEYPYAFNSTTNRWITIEELINNGKLTGNFEQNGNLIIEYDLTGEKYKHMLPTLVYAILYSDGDLCFNRTGAINEDKLASGYTVTMNPQEISNLSISSAEVLPWNSFKTDIKNVTIEEVIVPKDTQMWFSGFTNLLAFNNFDNLRTYNVTSMSYMFEGCSNIETIDLSKFDTSKTIYMRSMFQDNVKLKNLNVGRFDTSNVINMQRMFQNCSNLEILNVSNLNTSNVTDLSYMFSGCTKLLDIDVSNFDTSKVTTINNLFENCSNLIDIDVSNIDTTNMESMQNLFYGCSSLKKLNLGNFSTENCTNMNRVFYNCENLVELNLSSAIFDKVTSYNDIFTNVNSNIVVIVKDYEGETVVPKTWIQERLGTGVGNVYTVTEWQSIAAE